MTTEQEWLEDPGNADDLLRRGDVTDMLMRLANEEADLALYGAPENATHRQAHEAALTRARCAIALMPPREALAAAPEDKGWREPNSGEVYSAAKLAELLEGRWLAAPRSP